MRPAPGERIVRFVGDSVRFTLRHSAAQPLPAHWQARLRTNLGRSDAWRNEILEAHTKNLPPAGASWRDLPMKRGEDEWFLELPLTEVGYFNAKAYALDENDWQHWPAGPDVGISVHPNGCRTANTIYCAFTRLFGETKSLPETKHLPIHETLGALEKKGYATLPPSGKLRDLVAHLPHIFDTLGCRILHLLPIHPTPTTYARFGRFGSPYAALDLTAIDPALVVFDKRTTGVDQFRELAYAVHRRDGKLFLDIVINHTGWGSVLQENHPEWFARDPTGTFISPGAWGNIWEDLVELEHRHVALWDKIADALLTWCRRGVDGFRCDAGYKVPVNAWQYIIARVQREFPETIFLLEGLGGAWEATESLLAEGGMQWAYSELFQNYSAREVSRYLDHSIKQNTRAGLLVHYSETHDNERLAVQHQLSNTKHETPNTQWSLLRNRLCALTSVSGGFGFTCGVEWLATEKIRVHDTTGLNWDARDNLVKEIARLNRLLQEHPCFFDGAKLTRLSVPDSPVFALRRDSAEGQDSVLILVNTDVTNAQTLTLDSGLIPSCEFDLLNAAASNPPGTRGAASQTSFTLAPAAVHCFASAEKPLGMSGDDYRRARAQAAWAIENLGRRVRFRAIPSFPWRELAALVEENPAGVLTAISSLDFEHAQETDGIPALKAAIGAQTFPRVVEWRLPDRRRVTIIPPDHWLLIRDSHPFRATLIRGATRGLKNELLPGNHAQSIPVRGGHVVCFAPTDQPGDATLFLERYDQTEQHVEAAVRFLAFEPAISNTERVLPAADDLILLTNGRGGMARLCVDLGRVKSKYDCVLAANLHATVPVDRHVFIKRMRVWVNADGFISPLDINNLARFEPGPPARWHFVANSGDGRNVQICLSAEMPRDRNTIVFRFSRLSGARRSDKQLPDDAGVRLTVRFDIEDRNFHSETRRNGGAEFHFASNTRPTHNSELNTQKFDGFEFTPASDRSLRVMTSAGAYHPSPEWSENIPHPWEQRRGQTASGDAFSPGWFELPLPQGGEVSLVATAEAVDDFGGFELHGGDETRDFESILQRAIQAFVVRRDGGKTVIAGYPWFLDWGRDTLICARGLLAAGRFEDVKQLLVTFGRFEENGTLPNAIYGENASNRDTVDAPLWFGLVCEEFSRDRRQTSGVANDFYSTVVDQRGRTIRDILRSIAVNYIRGTPNGVRMDAVSGLIWSPSHFTWMDTNHPAGTPREGYAIEIQALWIRLLRQIERLGIEPEFEPWLQLATRAEKSLNERYWLDERGYFADVLLARAGKSAAEATPDSALRSNYLFAVSLGLVTGEKAKRCVEAALRWLVVPGALRTLAPLPVSPPLPIYSHGRLVNNPHEPYWERYEGDEDTRRKPAYHNGTAWVWTFPTFCEALARAWDFSPEAVAAAKAYLGSVDTLLVSGCIGQLPEILDGDAPHAQRGCDAQSWSVTEVQRVWKLILNHGRLP